MVEANKEIDSEQAIEKELSPERLKELSTSYVGCKALSNKVRKFLGTEKSDTDLISGVGDIIALPEIFACMKHHVGVKNSELRDHLMKIYLGGELPVVTYVTLKDIVADNSIYEKVYTEILDGDIDLVAESIGFNEGELAKIQRKVPVKKAGHICVDSIVNMKESGKLASFFEDEITFDNMFSSAIACTMHLGKASSNELLHTGMMNFIKQDLEAVLQEDLSVENSLYESVILGE